MRSGQLELPKDAYRGQREPDCRAPTAGWSTTRENYSPTHTVLMLQNSLIP